MRPQTVAPPRRSAARSALAAIASVALALAGCSFDLELPAVPSGPTLSEPSPFSPAAAYAGQLIRLTGSRFDADPGANTVNFAFASARALRFEGGALVVRVPADAGDGPITVTNRDGTSAASATAFDYLGLGEPRLPLAASPGSAIYQRPRAIYPLVAGDLVMDSFLHGGLVWAGNTGFAAQGVDRSAADPGSGMLYVASDPLIGPPKLRVISATTGLEIASVTLPAKAKQILPVPSLGVVLTFHDGVATEELGAWDATTLGQRTLDGVLGAVPYGVESFSSAADVGDGRIVVAGMDASYAFTLNIVDVAAKRATTANATVALGAPPPITEVSNGGTAAYHAPLAVGRANGTGAHLAAVALDDGNIGLADLDAATPAFLPSVKTFSPTLVDSIAVGTSGRAIATKPGDDLSVEFELATGRMLFGVATPSPRVVSALGDLAFIAGDGDNDVAAVNLATGSRVATIGFDVAPGVDALRYDGLAAFIPGASGVDGDLLFPSSTFSGLLRYSTYTGATTGVERTAAVAAVASDVETRSLWAAYGGVVPAVVGFPLAAWTAPVAVLLPAGAQPQRMAARGTLVAVGHSAGITAFDGAVPPVGAAPGATIPGVSGAASFHAVGFTDAGKVWALVATDAGDEAQLWSAPPIASTATPGAGWSVPGTARTAVWLEDGLWVFWYDGVASREKATLLDAGMQEVRTVTLSDSLVGVHAVSPNGRLLVVRESTLTVGFLVRLFRADPDAGFPEVGGLVFDSRVSGFAFDATGERLFVLTQSPDRVITVD